MKVHRILGAGYLEAVYQRSLMIELRKTGIQAEEQRAITVFYDDQAVGDFVADILVEDEVIVEYKAVSTLIRAHEVQLVNYLTATRKDIGILLNFGSDSLQYRKKFRIRNQTASSVIL